MINKLLFSTNNIHVQLSRLNTFLYLIYEFNIICEITDHIKVLELKKKKKSHLWIKNVSFFHLSISLYIYVQTGKENQQFL